MEINPIHLKYFTPNHKHQPRGDPKGKKSDTSVEFCMKFYGNPTNIFVEIYQSGPADQHLHVVAMATTEVLKYLILNLLK